MWITLTLDEWDYLLFDRKTKITGVGNSNASFARVKVNGVNGLILFPDTFTWTSEMGNKPRYINDDEPDFDLSWSEVTSYTDTQFKAQESAGMVFLPACGDRYGSTFSDTGISSYYWSRTISNDVEFVWGMDLIEYDDIGVYGVSREVARSVPLVMSEN